MRDTSRNDDSLPKARPTVTGPRCTPVVNADERDTFYTQPQTHTKCEVIIHKSFTFNRHRSRTSQHSMSESIDPSEAESEYNLYAERDDLVVERDVLLVSLSVAHTNLAKKEIEIHAISKTLGAEIDTLTGRLQVG